MLTRIGKSLVFGVIVALVTNAAAVFFLSMMALNN
jgi:hypothetical protein